MYLGTDSIDILAIKILTINSDFFRMISALLQIKQLHYYTNNSNFYVHLRII